jgi:hypothetical protein
MTRRLYGLFEKIDGKWVRLHPTMGYTKETAVRVFQGALLDGFFSGRHIELRTLPKGLVTAK